MRTLSKTLGVMSLTAYPTLSASTSIDPADIHSNTPVRSVCYSEEAFNIQSPSGQTHRIPVSDVQGVSGLSDIAIHNILQGHLAYVRIRRKEDETYAMDLNFRLLGGGKDDPKGTTTKPVDTKQDQEKKDKEILSNFGKEVIKTTTVDTARRIGAATGTAIGVYTGNPANVAIGMAVGETVGKATGILMTQPEVIPALARETKREEDRRNAFGVYQEADGRGIVLPLNPDRYDPRVDPKTLDHIQKSFIDSAPHLDPKISKPVSSGGGASGGASYDRDRSVGTNFGPSRYTTTESQRGGGNGYDSATGNFIDNRDPFERGTGCIGSDGIVGGQSRDSGGGGGGDSGGGDCSIM